MRKNYFHTKNLEGVYYLYQIDGLNQDRLIKNLKNGGITLYNVKKTSNRTMSLQISVKQDKIFFAILKKMCYTNVDKDKKLNKQRKRLFKKGVIATQQECGYQVTKIATRGIKFPLFYLFTNIGLTIGAIAFIFGGYFFNDYLLAFDFVGSGSVLQQSVTEDLNTRGVTKWQRFSKLDLNLLADEILADNPLLSYASCTKRGNKLVVELVLAKNGTDHLDESVKNLVCDVDGVVEELKVYRGTPLVAVGDRVKSGDLLVDGFVEHKDIILPTSVLAKVVVMAEFVWTMESEFNDREPQAELLATEILDRQIVSSKIQKQQTEKGFLYTVTLYYKRVFVAG